MQNVHSEMKKKAQIVNYFVWHLISNLMDLLYLVCHAKIIKEAATSDHESYFIKLEFVPTYKSHLYSIDL